MPGQPGTTGKLFMFESSTEIVWSALIALAGGLVASSIAKALRAGALIGILLYIWHTILAASFNAFVLSNMGDALDYYQRARFDYVEPNIGTEFVAWLTSFGTSVGLTFWPISLFYNLAGSIGLIFFYSAMREATEAVWNRTATKTLVVVCTLIPSMSFWTAGIGKDAIAFLSVGLFLWATVDLSRRQLVAAAAALIMMSVRPHIAVLMVAAVGAGTVFVPNVRAATRFGMTALSAGIATIAVPFVLLYTGAGQFSTLKDFITDRQEHNLGGGSSIDISGMNPALRVLSFLFRPLPNEASGFGQLASSADNLILIAITIFGLITIYRSGMIRVFRSSSITVIYALSCIIVLSQVTANLGLAAREKWMAVPALMLVILRAWRLFKEQALAKRAAAWQPSLDQTDVERYPADASG